MKNHLKSVIDLVFHADEFQGIKVLLCTMPRNIYLNQSESFSAYLPFEHRLLSCTSLNLGMIWTQQKIRVCIKHGQKEIGQRFTFSQRLHG